MKSFLKMLFFAALVVAIVFTAGLNFVHAETVEIPCIAQYRPLTPNEAIGEDGCGHVWKAVFPMSEIDRANAKTAKVDASMGHAAGDSVECFYWELDSGAYFQVPCPSPGDTLGVIEMEVN